MLFLSQPQVWASTSSGSSRLAKRVLLGSLKSLVGEDSTSEGSKSQSEGSTGLAPESKKVQGTPKDVILTALINWKSLIAQGPVISQPKHECFE